jgi:hypothetical protein
VNTSIDSIILVAEFAKYKKKKIFSTMNPNQIWVLRTNDHKLTAVIYEENRTDLIPTLLDVMRTIPEDEGLVLVRKESGIEINPEAILHWCSSVSILCCPETPKKEPCFFLAQHIPFDFTVPRNGWGFARGALLGMSSTSQELRFFDFLDNQIAFSGVTPSPDRPWAAIIHHPPRMPPFWDPSCLPSVYMKTPAFVESLSSCRFLVTLSQHLADSIRDLIQNDHIPIHVILHPTRIPRTVFSMESLHANQNPKLISIGWSFRRLTSIYQIGQVTSYQRAWLIGKQIHRVMSLLRDESQHERVEIVFGSVQIIHDLPITEYDSLLSENIAFIDVYDASANNAVVECIVRRTPLVARRHPALEEYLGSEYPLFYDHLDEVTDEFLSMTRIQSAYDHLSSIPADRFSILHFYEKIFLLSKKN